MHIDNLTKENLKAMLLECDDDAGHHTIWVSNDGIVSIDLITKKNIPTGHSEVIQSRAKFQYETWPSGNDYVGKKAADHELYVDMLYRNLKGHWKSDAKGLIDLWKN